MKTPLPPVHVSRGLSFHTRLAALLLSLALAGSACGNSPTPTTPTPTPTPTSGATVTLSPLTLTLATTGAQSVTMTNSGTATLNISGIAVSGNFTESHDCAATLDPGASCTISLTFVPLGVTSPGFSSGMLTITDDASTSPQSVTISGPMVTPATGALTPKVLTFGPQAVGTPSAVQTVTLSNLVNGSATVALGVISISADGDFAVARNGCSSQLIAGGGCPVDVVFTPTAPGPRTGFLTVVSNAAVGLIIIPLNGVGQ